MLGEKAKAIAELYIASGKAAVRSKQGSNIPPDFRLLDGWAFKILDLEQQVVCRGSICEEVGQRSRIFLCKMTGTDDELVLCQADLCSKLGLKPNYTLTQHIILENFQLSLSQLSARVGQLLPPVVVTPDHPKLILDVSDPPLLPVVFTTAPSQAVLGARFESPQGLSMETGPSAR